jgi:hypothetical protein
MPKGFPKRGDELMPLEGGVSGSGGGVTRLAKELVGGAGIVGGMYGVGQYDRQVTKEADKMREENSRAQYEHEKEAGDPNAVKLSFEEWKKL